MDAVAEASFGPVDCFHACFTFGFEDDAWIGPEAAAGILPELSPVPGPSGTGIAENAVASTSPNREHEEEDGGGSPDEGGRYA